MIIMMLCNGCLNSGCKIYVLNVDEIQSFKDLTKLQVENTQTVHLCWECKAAFRKCMKFTQNCQKADGTIQCFKGQLPSQESLNNVRKNLNLFSNLIQCNLESKPILIEFNPEQEKSVDSKLEIKCEFDEIFVNDYYDDSSNDNLSIAKLKNVKNKIKTRLKNNKSLAKNRNSKSENDKTSKTNKIKKINFKPKENNKELDNSRSKLEIAEIKLEGSKTVLDISRFKKRSRRKGNDRRKFKEDYVTVRSLSFEEQKMELQKRKLSKKFQNSKFKCNFCFKGYGLQKTYDNHYRFNHHESAGNFICDLCNSRKLTKRKIYLHIKQHMVSYICKQCSFISSCTSQAKRHEEFHQGKKYQCDKCGGTYTRPGAYYSHIKRKHSSTFVCEICGENFTSESGLGLHRSKMFHRKSSSLNGPHCDLCNVTFMNDAAWKRHLSTTDKHRLECDPSDTRNKVGSSTITEIRAYKPRAPRKKPVFKHFGEKKDIPCEQCGKIFANERAYAAHQQSVHEGIKVKRPKRYLCVRCDSRFTTPYMLRIHQNSAHGERAMYACDKCDKRYRTPTALVVHKNAIHLGVKYKCYFCVREYTTTGALSYHIKTLHFNQKMPPRNRNKKRIIGTDE